jgi:hypothetical protein
VAQIQITIQNKYLGYKGLDFVKNIGCSMKHMDKGLKVTKWTSNTPKFICPNRLPKPKSWDFYEKKALSGVRSP